MARAKGDVRIRISQDGAENTSRKVQGITGSLNGMRSAVSGLVSALAARELAQFGLESAKLAGQADAASASFEKLSRAAGRDAVADLESLRKASDGMMSDLKAMQTGVTAMAADISFDDLVTSLEYVRRFSQSTGQDFETRWNTIMLGLARGSAKMLDDVGIIVSGTENVVSRAVDQMRAKMHTLGTDEDNVALATQRMAVQWENARIKIGRMYAPKLLPWLQDITDWLGRIGNTDLENVADDLKAMGAAAEQIAELNRVAKYDSLKIELKKYYSELQEIIERGEKNTADGFDVLISRLAARADHDEITASLEKSWKMVVGGYPDSKTARERYDELKNLLTVLTQIDTIQREMRILGGEEERPPVEKTGDEVVSEEEVDITKKFATELKHMNSEVAVGKKGLSDLEGFLNGWKTALESGTIEAQTAYNEAVADLYSRQQRQRDKDSTEIRNAAIEQARAILATENIAYEERLQMAVNHLRSVMETNDLLADDVKAMLDEIAQYQSDLNEQQAEQMRFMAGVVQGILGPAISAVVSDLLDGELSAKRFGKALLEAALQAIAQYAILNVLLNTLFPTAGFSTMFGKGFGLGGGAAASTSAGIASTASAGYGSYAAALSGIGQTLSSLNQNYQLPDNRQVTINEIYLRNELGDLVRFHEDVTLAGGRAYNLRLGGGNN